ncbi:MAG: type VI secretion protein, partial [Solirubrobacteraceae bacterium]
MNAGGGTGSSNDFWLVPLAFLVALGVVLYWAGRLAAILAGTAGLHGHALAEFAALAHVDDPSAAWHANVGSPVVYWLLEAVALVVACGVAVGVWWVVSRLGGRTRGKRVDDPAKVEGLASRREVRKAASGKALLRRAGTLRPSL